MNTKMNFLYTYLSFSLSLSLNKAIIWMFLQAPTIEILLQSATQNNLELLPLTKHLTPQSNLMKKFHKTVERPDLQIPATDRVQRLRIEGWEDYQGLMTAGPANGVRGVRIFFTASHREALYCQYQDIGASALTRLATLEGYACMEQD